RPPIPSHWPYLVHGCLLRQSYLFLEKSPNTRNEEHLALLLIFLDWKNLMNRFFPKISASFIIVMPKIRMDSIHHTPLFSLYLFAIKLDSICFFNTLDI